MAHYSDNGVDEALESLLPAFGYACDVGANDGVFNSNTLALEEKGWLILCVEANPLLEELGRARRKLWRSVAIGDRDMDDVVFHICGPMANWASRSSLGLRDGGGPADQTAFVSVRRLDRILKEAGFPRLDLLTVDVENWEREVMAGFSVERWKPKVIVLEEWTDDNLAIPGYTILKKLSYDNIYVRDAA